MNVSKCVRVGAVYDLVSVGPLAVPALAQAYVGLVEDTGTMLGLPGRVGDIAPTGWMLVHMLAIVVVSASVVRYRSPTLDQGLAEAFNRLLILAILVFYLSLGAPAILWGIALIEAGLLVGIALALIKRGYPG